MDDDHTEAAQDTQLVPRVFLWSRAFADDCSDDDEGEGSSSSGTPPDASAPCALVVTFHPQLSTGPHSPLPLIDGVPTLVLPWSHPRVGYPDRSWSGRLVASENRAVQLASMNAYISTLGGGAFLTRRITYAMELAKRQMAVAVAMGDPGLVARCHVHLAYCWIQTGNFGRAMRSLTQLEVLGLRLGDATLLSMVAAARRYCRRTYQLWVGGALGGDGAVAAIASAPDEEAAALVRQHQRGLRSSRGSSAGSEESGGGQATGETTASLPVAPGAFEAPSTHDELYRQRLVKLDGSSGRAASLGRLSHT